MNESYDTQTVNPSIEKYVSASNNGIETHKFTRCVIGYILHGEKYVYYDDKCYKFSQGDLFFLGMGCHLYQKHPRAGTSLRTDPRSLYLGRAATHPAAPQHRLQAEYHQQPPVRRLPYPEPRHDAGWSSIRRFSATSTIASRKDRSWTTRPLKTSK